MIAYCGLTCDSCSIHLATLEKDKSQQQTMRESIVEQCSQLYGMNLQLVDITDCDGCKANSGKLFSGCWNCEIRKCASVKNIENCAYCSDYACGILKEYFSHDSSAQARLEKIRRTNKI
jgi:hypothetical protein